MKKWNIQNKLKVKSEKLKVENLVEVLLHNRGITTKKEIDAFLHPQLEDVTVGNVGIDLKQLKKTVKRLQKAFDNKEQVIIFGDYDVDGITGTAILWETLYGLKFNVLPYIPHRADEGYGLSIRGIENLKSQNPNSKLIITVDNGIVADEAVKFANTLGIDVIITDHHLPEKDERPNAYSIVHTTKLCGAGVAWLLSQQVKSLKLKVKSEETEDDDHLELATLGTIADLVPLTGANRTIVKFGLEKVRQTKRLGLLSLFREAGIDPLKIGTYEVGFMIAPRLNAAGRIESAMDSLRLLCTKSLQRANDLANNLGRINRERQQIMRETIEDAVAKSEGQMAKGKMGRIIFIGDESYNPGVIGLVAGKLVEQFYRPAIVLSLGETHAKASVRSIAGVNIIEFLRKHVDMYVNVGGHPMAAGFTVEISKMQELKLKLEQTADASISDDFLVRSLKIDCELPLHAITPELFASIQQLAPFGMGNPEPAFATRNVEVVDIRTLGQEGKHLKLRISQPRHSRERSDSRIDSGQARMTVFDVIGFGLGELGKDLSIGDKIDIAYTIDENKWNGNVNLQLKLRDIQIHKSES